MNTLSWALLAADALDSLKFLLCLLAIGFGPVLLIATAIRRDDAGSSFSRSEPPPWPKKAVMAAVCMAFVACVIPSAKTVYLIAASEVGERVAGSPEGREMLDLLRRKIRDALSDKA